MMRRAMVFVLALLWLALGLALILTPWLELWQTNYFVYTYPAVGLLIRSPYIRGAVSGLGVLDVLLSLEAIRHWTSAVVTRS
ncbi:MAG: hypothetical protein KGL75_09810 [Acidobacteriota bacterium]|nr:hypothetical protein [Acidobacteriota bacterium]